MIIRLKVYSRLLFHVAMIPVYLIVPRNKKKIVFGAWFGRRYGCNPKYMLKYILEHDDSYKCVWIAEESVRKCVEEDCRGVKFVRRGSLEAYWHLLTAKWYVCNVGWYEDIDYFPTCGRVTVLHLGHGIPNKSSGLAQLNGNGVVSCSSISETGCWARRFGRRCVSAVTNYLYPADAWISVAGDWMGDILVATHGKRFTKDRLLYFGTPRNDYMVQNKRDEKLKQTLKEKISKILGVNPSKRWWIYVPTWRHADAMPFTFVSARLKDEYNQLFEKNGVILIEKQHPKTFEKFNVEGGLNKSVYVVRSELADIIDVQELLLCCDRLISDYSAIYYDFALLNRPVIEWTYDYENVAKNDFGLEYDLREYAPGPFAYTEEELLTRLSESDSELLAGRTVGFYEHIKYEKGVASESLLKYIQARS